MTDYQRIVFEDISNILNIASDYKKNVTPEMLIDLYKPCLEKLGVAIWQNNWFTPPLRLSTGDQSRTDSFVISERPGNPDERMIYHFDTPHGGYFQCIFVPVADIEITEELNKCYEYVAQNIFIMLGRAFLSKAYGYLNIHEDLSGAHNRRFLESTVARLVRENKLDKYVAAHINLKNLKRINEKYNSKTGDVFIKKFVEVMMATIDEDEVFTRLGGDNFILLVKESRTNFFNDMLLHLEIEVPTEEEGLVRFKVKMRAGIYNIMPGDHFGIIMESTSEALRRSRLPEYDDFVWYESEMNRERVSERNVLEEFPKALKKKEFVAYYQPKVLLETSTLYGAEALCRWVKKGDLIPPADFIPALERDGAITKLDFYMLEKVCQDIASWTKQGLDPGRVSVNFSKNHLRDDKFGEKIVDIIDKYKVGHQYIEIELTETTGFDKGAMTEFVRYMKSMDIATSVDDFGTGYSSLNMISGVGTDIIKLDKSFIDNIEEQPYVQQNLVKNIVNMINDLSMETVAEGVESIDQAKLLRKWECRVVQGYLYDKPLCVEDYTYRLKNPVYEIKLDEE